MEIRSVLYQKLPLLSAFFSQFILIGEQIKVGIPGNNRQEHSTVALIARGVEEGIVPVTTTLAI
ncbi:MAG: hypothetical protein ACK55Z_28530, partial [bacterium]